MLSKRVLAAHIQKHKSPVEANTELLRLGRDRKRVLGTLFIQPPPLGRGHIFYMLFNLFFQVWFACNRTIFLIKFSISIRTTRPLFIFGMKNPIARIDDAGRIQFPQEIGGSDTNIARLRHGH